MAGELFKGRTVLSPAERAHRARLRNQDRAGGGRIALWVATWIAPSIRRLAGRCHAVAVDVTDDKSIAAALATTEKQLAAPRYPDRQRGITGPTRRSCSIRRCLEAGDRHQLTGVFLSNRAVVAGMVKRAGAVSSTSPRSPARKAIQRLGLFRSKAGVIGLTKSLGKELGDDRPCW